MRIRLDASIPLRFSNRTEDERPYNALRKVRIWTRQERNVCHITLGDTRPTRDFDKTADISRSDRGPSFMYTEVNRCSETRREQRDPN